MSKLFEIENIIGVKEDENGLIHYWVKWKGYPESNNTWEPKEKFVKKPVIMKMVTTFYKKLIPPKQKVPPSLRKKVWDRQFPSLSKGFCPCCRKNKIDKKNFHAGHIIAASKGGKMEVENLRPVCRDCNLQMRTQHMRTFCRTMFHKNLQPLPKLKEENVKEEK